MKRILTFLLLLFTVFTFTNDLFVEAIEKFARDNFGPEATIVSLQVKSSPGEFDEVELISRSRSRSMFSFLFKAFKEKKFCGYARVQAEIAVFKEVIVAARTIRSGELLSEKDVQLQRVNLLDLNVEHCSELGQVVGKIARRMFRQNEPIDGRYLLRPPDVKAGQLLTAVVQIGSVSATAQVRAMKDAYVGERIQVRNVSSGALIEGLLQRDLTVLVVGG